MNLPPCVVVSQSMDEGKLTPQNKRQQPVSMYVIVFFINFVQYSVEFITHLDKPYSFV